MSAFLLSGAKRRMAVLLFGLLFIAALLLALRFSSTTKSLLTPSTKVAYGVNVDITAMIPDTPYTVRTASGGDFFDLAAQLGINTLRITDVQWTTTGKVHSRAIWQHVFDEAEKHHMNVILMLIDIDADTDGSQHTALAEAHSLLGDYGLAHAPALWLVDLNNEPDVSDPQQMTELREEAAYVRKVVPKVPITIGGWKSEVPEHPGKFDWQDPADIPKLIDLVDVVSPHLYGFDQDAQHGITTQQSTRSFLAAVRQKARGKPILLEEFGAGNGLAPTTDPTPTGSPAWQASVYRGVLQEVKAEHNQGVIGAIAWIIAPRPPFPNSDSYRGDMTGWAFVLNHGQHLLPAAKEFSTVAHGK